MNSRERDGEDRKRGAIKVGGGGGRERESMDMNNPIPSLSLLCANVNKSPCGNTVNQFYYSIKHFKPTQSIF